VRDFRHSVSNEQATYQPADMDGLTDGWVDRLMVPSLPAVRIALVGKYTHLADSYLSVTKAITHSSLALKCRTEMVWVEASWLEDANKGTPEYDTNWAKLRSAHGILVPGGFGDRGVAGKVLASAYAREHSIPYFGICLGMQVAVIDVVRYAGEASASVSVSATDDVGYL